MGRDANNSDAADVGDLASDLLRKLRGGDFAEPPATAEELEARRLRDEADLARRNAEDQRRYVRDALKSALPPRVFDVVMAGAESTPAVEATLAWANSERHRVLLLRGGIGVGKTVAAGAAVSAFVERGQRGISWHRPNDFVSAVLHQYDENAPKLGRHLVVIDDVGRETKAEFCEALCAFIDDFSARILLSTNDTKERFRSRYDVRLIDRLNEIGTSIGIKGESRRGNGGGF